MVCPAPACGFVHWDNPTPVVAAIVEHEGELILARNKAWAVPFFALITGFLERSDPSPAEAVMREVKEELGLDAQGAHFVGHYRFERQNQIILAYHVPATGQITLRSSQGAITMTGTVNDATVAGFTAIASAVPAWSPVIIATWMPARRAWATAAGTLGRSGSSKATRPSQVKS